MKSKNRNRIVKRIILGLLIVVGIIFYKRPDFQFILSNTLSKVMEESDIVQIEVHSKELKSVSIEDIKDNKTNIIFNNTLALINEEYPINDSILGHIIKYKDTNIKMDESVISPYEKISNAVKDATEDHLYIMDGYRSNGKQEEVYKKDNSLAAIPGSSEHEIGLALDVYVEYFAGYGFLKSEAGQWINKNSWEYGFIIRYPLFKRFITGIKFEPWHIRYVGLPHSEIIYKDNITLEEYIENLEVGLYYQSREYEISRQSGDKLLIRKDLVDVVVSPDNMGNYIITGKIIE